jgi:L,D-peptidoglycan transpeptidase YkuD (ErfK/YbiS/YcfS/YnhG family)
MPSNQPPALAHAAQLVVVTTPSWSSVPGTLWRFARANPNEPWKAESSPTPVVVGRTGLAWGVGFDDRDAAAVGGTAQPHKHEGDGRSPAGVFPLDTVFGFAPHADMSFVRMPYVQLTEGSDCVDDVASLHYNTVVSRDAQPRIDWSSAERMREVWQYEMGVIVGYNASPPVRGRGSCIFLHIWNGPESSTAGCTALDRGELRRIIEWLDDRRRPVLVQLPVEQYEALQARWGLPVLTAGAR